MQPGTDKFDHLMAINTGLDFTSVLKCSFQIKLEVKAERQWSRNSGLFAGLLVQLRVTSSEREAYC